MNPGSEEYSVTGCSRYLRHVAMNCLSNHTQASILDFGFLDNSNEVTQQVEYSNLAYSQEIYLYL